MLPDDAVQRFHHSPFRNTVTQLVSSVNVGLVVTSPRISDYTFTLVSPTGQRVLLMENRGGDDHQRRGIGVYLYQHPEHHGHRRRGGQHQLSGG